MRRLLYQAITRPNIYGFALLIYVAAFAMG